jgi:protein TonB
MVVEKMPQYPGGDEELFKYLATNIKYPSDAKEQNIEGRVICQFVINRDGSVSDVVVVRSIAPSLDAEAVRVISAMPNWTPGEQHGQTVRVKYTLPINFKLDGEKKG